MQWVRNGSYLDHECSGYGMGHTRVTEAGVNCKSGDYGERDIFCHSGIYFNHAGSSDIISTDTYHMFIFLLFMHLSSLMCSHYKLPTQWHPGGWVDRVQFIPYQ